MNAIALNLFEPDVDHIPHLRRGDGDDTDTRFLVQFGGQGNAFLPELTRLYGENELLRPFFAMCFDALRDVQARPDVREVADRCYPYGFELRDWLRERNVPPEYSLFECPISFPGNTISQLALLYLISRCGYPLSELGRRTIATTGHSQGIVAATVFAQTARDYPDESAACDDFLQISYDWLVWFSMAGVYIKSEYVAPVFSPADSDGATIDPGLPTPMAVVFGPTNETIVTWIAEFNQAADAEAGETLGHEVCLALINSPTVHVIAGHAADLDRFRRRYSLEFATANYDWEYLPVSAPFHCGSHLRAISQRFARDAAYTSLNYRTQDIYLPIVSFVDGEVIPGASSLVDHLSEMLFHKPLDWYRTLRAIQSRSSSLTHVIDLGPGRTSAALTGKFFADAAGQTSQATEVELISLNRAAGLKRFLT